MQSTAQSISSSSPKFSALSSALERPFARQTGGRSIRHTPDQPGDSPHHSTPEDTYFSGSVRLVRPLNEAYPFQSEKARDKDLKKHGDLDHQAHSLSLPGLGFLIVTTWVTSMWIRAMIRSTYATKHDEEPETILKTPASDKNLPVTIPPQIRLPDGRRASKSLRLPIPAIFVCHA